MRDQAAELFEARTGSAWKPISGSKVNHRAMTAAVTDSRDFINAKRRAETEVLLPKGARILVTGGVDYQDLHRIWATLDKVRAKHPDMVLLHGGALRGAELIAARWAGQELSQRSVQPEASPHGIEHVLPPRDRLPSVTRPAPRPPCSRAGPIS
jgi:hypothetical protein